MNYIYQQWAGAPKNSAYVGARVMAAYAGNIGAKHDFVVRPRPVHEVGPGSKYYDKFLPIWRGTADRYDKVMFADTDLFPVDGIGNQDVFEGFTAEVGLCTEPLQPAMREAARGGICGESDERWAAMVLKEYGVELPRNDVGLLKVYNTGLVLFSHEGVKAARRHFVPPQDYIKLCAIYKLPPFYAIDQNYLHAMIFYCWNPAQIQELDNDWNRFVHYVTRDREIVGVSDQRTPTTKMVHIQLRGADDFDEETLRRVTNLPQSEWRLP